MSDYTPTTERVRDGYVYAAFDPEEDDPSTTAHHDEFDRWLAEELAWAYTKGYNAAIAASPTGVFYDAWNDENNPYRKTD